MKIMPETPQRSSDLFKRELKVINVGLELFFNELTRQSVKSVQVDWIPPRTLEKDLDEILDKLL